MPESWPLGMSRMRPMVQKKNMLLNLARIGMMTLVRRKPVNTTIKSSRILLGSYGFLN